MELRYPTILDSLDSGDADLDFDNDGKTNKEELNDPINPTDPGDAVFETIRFETSDRFNIAAAMLNRSLVSNRIVSKTASPGSVGLIGSFNSSLFVFPSLSKSRSASPLSSESRMVG